ncbi:LysR substrate-binding domain-containing protein [Halomonas sp.]|uniref:LysR substrate-binding domain-containing protein n=1 Tax=Halomonas sp. TaxID=1486246 RepID=UPI003A8DBF28
MDTRRLKYFVRIVELGSLTRSAEVLHIAQPALSQQVIALEKFFGKRLLIRSKKGVVPTEAGNTLYRHAQQILKQMEQARSEIDSAMTMLTGTVSIGVAPYSSASVMVLPLLMAAREKYPGIVMHINENFSSAISEMVTSRKLDMALIYDPGKMKGLTFEHILDEEICLIGSKKAMSHFDGKPIGIEQIPYENMILPSQIHLLRSQFESVCAKAGFKPRIIAEIESLTLLSAAVAKGLGYSLLPVSVARDLNNSQDIDWIKIDKEVFGIKMALCSSDVKSFSEPAIAINNLIHDIAEELGLIERSVREQKIKP